MILGTVCQPRILVKIKLVVICDNPNLYFFSTQPLHISRHEIRRRPLVFEFAIRPCVQSDGSFSAVSTSTPTRFGGYYTISTPTMGAALSCRKPCEMRHLCKFDIIRAANKLGSGHEGGEVRT